MKLKSITFPDIPTLGNLGHITIADPPDKLRGWTVAVRGPAVFLISPRGWSPGKALAVCDRDGEQTAFEVPRSDCRFAWSDPKAVDVVAVAKWQGEPMTTSEDRRLAAVAKAQAAEQKS